MRARSIRLAGNAVFFEVVHTLRNTLWPTMVAGDGHVLALDGKAPGDGCGEASLIADAVRKVDIAHSGQTVVEAMEQLKVEVRNARRDREIAVLVVHGFGASGIGGAIKAALSTELPGLARQYGFKAYSHADRDRIPKERNVDARSLNPGSTLLIFREAQSAKDSTQDFRPNFRNLRSKVKVRARRSR